MAMNIDNSGILSSEEIKKILINTFNRAIEKSVQDAKYDKTILATVQFCTDATIGQYKVKYQNGYFTAYSQDVNVVYSNGASVYITVPENNFNNRLIISGLATSDSSAKTYVTKLEGDQQYMQKGPSLITMADNEIGLSTYIGVTGKEPQLIPIYMRDYTASTVNRVTIGPNGEDNPLSADGYIKTADNAIRFGATFRTAISEDKQNTGDYGIRLGLRFLVNGDKTNPQYEIKYYELNTFTMTGTPFNYTIAMPQYNYWEIDCSTFDRIESIVAYCKEFSGEYDPEQEPDIFITDISLYGATKLYDTNDDKYKVEIVAEQGYKFEAGTSLTSLPFSAKLRVDGNEVKSIEEQGLKYFWAKEDATVNSSNNKRYNPYTGKGWRCLNDGYIKSFNQAVDPSQLKDLTYVITDDTDLTDVKAFVWQENMNAISLKKSSCKGRVTKLKCVIVYNNTPISAVIEVYNEDGIYLIMESSNGTQFYGGIGYTNLTVGAFKDGQEGLINVTLPDDTSEQTRIHHYLWTITDPLGEVIDIPPTDPNELIIIDVEGAWDRAHKVGSISYDDEIVSDTDVNLWLAEPGHENFELCKERYNYYSEKFNEYAAIMQSGEGTAQDREYLTVCQERRDSIITKTKLNISKLYAAGVENIANRYIFGPSNVTAQYIDDTVHNYTNVEITDIENYYYSDDEQSDYQKYNFVDNTLFNLSALNVGVRANVTVTAIIKNENQEDEAITSTSILLESVEAANLDYSLEIVNGTQTFVYTEGGISPTNKNVSSPITLRPLYFRLYDKAGNLVYDSENADSEENSTNITELAPVWTFYTPARSMLQTVYQGHPHCHALASDVSVLQLENEGKFVYTLAEEFDIKKRDESNVQLQITYNNAAYYSSTSFTFAKEGELGTNGTNTYLDVINPTYEIYKTSILESCYGSRIKEKVNGVEVENYYSPAERHLKNTYLYATQAYNSNGSAAERVADVDYVNLKFVNINSSNPNEIEGTDEISLYGQWYENGVKETIDATSKWSTMEGDGYAVGGYICSKPPINIEIATGDHTQVCIQYHSEHPYMAYKPTTIDNFIYKNKTSKRTANDVVRVEASKEITNQLDADGNPVTRKNYGYYTMPYFFYHNSINTPEKLDPAKHIIIVGGFDEVVYDSAGLNPEYDKEHPFKFFLIDEEGENITEEFLTAIQNDSSKGTIEWKCSPGFSYPSAIGEVPSYESYSYDIDLYGKYCTHNTKFYKCIKSHTRPSIDYNIVDDEGKIIKAVQAGDFIDDYWEEIDSLAIKDQEFKLTPNSTYEAVAQTTLFNSWVSVYVYYNRGAKGIIEAEALIPINMLCNRYGSEVLNGWDGKSTKIGDAYVLSSKVAAGRKYEDNSFLGVTLGENMYPDSDDRKNEVGLFGYGRIDKNDPTSWARTFFLDSETGRAILGPTGSSQIILDPTPQTQGGNEVWSKINGWYISPNFFYKPLGEANPLETSSSYNKKNSIFTDYAQGKKITPPTVKEGSAGMYVPWFGEVNKDDVFMWASSKVKNLDDETLVNEIKTLQRWFGTQGVTFDANMNMVNYDIIKKQKDDAIKAKQIEVQSLYDAWQDLIEAGASAEAIAQAKAAYDDADAELDNMQQNYELFTHNKIVYDDTVNEYKALKEQELSSYPTTYNDFNNKKSNFYVTYGGHLHATSASIEGNIIANSGRFGNGSNKISIAVTKDNVKYILYNKNFWVRDSSGDENEESAIYMKGKIMAKSGQFGQVGDDKDGNSANTVFIEYSWYPWHLPGDHEPWDNSHFYLDTNAGKTIKYALYHKNFHITNGGEVFFNGKLFTQSGRIGNWVINEHNIHSSNNAVYLNDDGNLTGGNDGQGNRTWYINSDGSASFDKIVNISTPSGFGFSCGGIGQPTTLHIPNGDQMTVGDDPSNPAYIRAGQDGHSITIGGSTPVVMNGGMKLNQGVFQIGDNGISIGTNGIVFSSSGASISSDGRATLKSTEIDGPLSLTSGSSLTLNGGSINLNGGTIFISGTSLENYIKSVISGHLTVSGTTGVADNHYHPAGNLTVTVS